MVSDSMEQALGMLGMLEHTVLGKSMIPHYIPSVLGLLLETPHTPQQPWEGCLVV